MVQPSQKELDKSSQSAREPLPNLKPLISEALDRRAPPAGENRKAWVMRLGDGIGRDWRTVQGWLYGETEPGGRDLLNLFAFLGPAFANEILSAIGFEAARAGDVKAVSDAAKLPRIVNAINNARAILGEAVE